MPRGARLIRQAHDQARKVLGGERAALDALAAELVAHEMVTAAKLDEILAAAGAKLPAVTAEPGVPSHVAPAHPPAKPRAAATRAKTTGTDPEPRG